MDTQATNSVLGGKRIARPASTEAITELATSMRDIFARVLQVALGTQETLNTCAYASICLAQALGRFLAVDAIVQGGDGRTDGAYVDRTGRPHGHYWVRATDLSDSSRYWCVDITADQFGDEPVVVLTRTQSLSRYVPGDQLVVDEAIAEVCSNLPLPEADQA